MKATVNTTTEANVNVNVQAENNVTTNQSALIKKEVINNVTLTGNLGAEPEVVELSNGLKKAKFRVATNRYFKNKQGEWQNETS